MGLFGNLPLRIIGVTGGVGTGKSTFCLDIDPECRNREGDAKTLVFDDEMSTSLYQHVFNFDLINVHSDERFNVGDKAKVWENFRDFWRKLDAGKYRVAILDTIWYWELCLDAWVTANPAEFNATAGQFKSMPAIKGSHLKAYLHLFVMQEILSKVEVLAFTSHLRLVWKNEKPTRETRPYGKSTWMQIAQLYLDLQSAVEPGKQVANPIPNAFVRKSRIMSTDGQPVLPPAFKEATPARLRDFINNPANWKKLTKDQVMPVVPEPTEAELQAMKAENLERELEIQQARLAVEEAKASARNATLEEKGLAPAPAVKKETEAVATKANDPPNGDSSQQQDSNPSPSEKRVSTETSAQLITLIRAIIEKKKESGDDHKAFSDKLKAWLVPKTHGETGLPHDLLPAELLAVGGRLNEVADQLGISTQRITLPN